MLTGLYPSRHGVKSHTRRLPDRVATLADILKQHGYVTAAVVNSHNLTQRYGIVRGFDDFTYVVEEAGETEPSAVGDIAET